MKTFYNHLHTLHQGKVEMFRGALVPCFEVAERADHVLSELQRRKLGDVLPPATFDATALSTVHSARYLNFLATAWDQWVALDPANADKDILPSVWPTRSFRTDVEPDNFAAKVGLYSFDAGTPFTRGTWVAARAGAHCALSAAQALLDGDSATFALSRPPGHHAGTDFFGGYSFLNNAALAAQHLRNAGMRKVAVLDVDYHHGNGTQAIFYDRPDVFYASIHGDPRTEYPFYLGHADEKGQGAGVGTNLNLPLPRGTTYAVWSEALETAIAAIQGFGAEALVVSLGLDSFEGDPISGFKLKTEDYLHMGTRLQKMRLPTALIFEGGYATSAIGVNAANVLQAFA